MERHESHTCDKMINYFTGTILKDSDGKWYEVYNYGYKEITKCQWCGKELK